MDSAPPERATPSRAASLRQLLIAVAAALGLVLVARAYEPAWHGTLLWDDHVLTDRGAAFRSLSLPDLLTRGFWPDDAFGDHRAPYYRPLVLLSVRFDAALGGRAEDFHVTNILLHLLGASLLALSAVRLGAKSGAAVAASLLWALAPRLTESVAWISGRTDVIAGVLGLAALCLSPDVGAPTRPGSQGKLAVGARSAASGLCLLGSLLGKEVGVAFVAALVVASWARLRPRPPVRTIARVATYVGAPLAVWLVLRSYAVRGARAPELSLGIGGRAGTVLEAIARYAEMLVRWSRPQTSIGMLGELDPARAAAGGVLLVAGLGLVFVIGRRLSIGARVGLVLALVAWLPVLHLVPLSLAGSVTADRLLYVPLMGLAIAGAVGARALAPRRQQAAALATLALVALSWASTRARAADYADEARFWVEAAERAHARNVVPRNALALAVQKAGAVDLSCRLYERSGRALEGTRFAWLPTHKRTLESLVNCWARAGRYDDAVRLGEELAHRFPSAGRVHLDLAFARLHVRDFDGASRAFTRATALDPRLGRVTAPILAAMGQIQADAIALGEGPADGRPALAWAKHLGELGRANEADAAYLAVALDTSLPLSDRDDALGFLVFDGSVASAETALTSLPEIHSFRRDALLSIVKRRRARLARVEALGVRIEALAR